MPKDFYEILGITKNATEEEIKRAYRKLAQKHHPDRNRGDKNAEAKFKEVNSAYEVLSDKQKRQQYDQFGQSAFTGGATGGTGGFDFGGFEGFGESFADIFETFFTGGPRSQPHSQARRGEDREVSLTISFEEAAFGVEKEIKLARIGECNLCKGRGAAPGSKIIVCSTCGGTGEIRRMRSTILGAVTTRRVCEKCGGEGRKAEKLCPDCSGSGRIRIAEKLRVKIPAGINDRMSIRIAEKGDAGFKGFQSGDLYVHIRIIPHKQFERKGEDVFSEIEIHLLQAVLGDTVEVPTIQGIIKMSIPTGTQDRKVFRLKGYGIQKLRGQGKGDHFVTVTIKIPEKLSKRERELYEQLAQEGHLKLAQGEKGFFKKIMGE